MVSLVFNCEILRTEDFLWPLLQSRCCYKRKVAVWLGPLTTVMKLIET